MSKSNWSQLILNLRSDNIKRSIRAAQKIDEMAEEANVPELYSLLNDENFWIREMAAYPLARLEGVKALPSLFQALTRGFQEGHDNDGLSAIIAQLLETNQEKATPLLLQILKSPDEETRANAAWALGFTASQIMPTVLLQVLETETIPKVRSAITGSLSSFHNSAEVFDKLLELMNDSDEQVKIDAIAGIGYLGNKKAIPHLKEVLAKSSSSRVQEFAEYALKNLES
jgi:HEAT repeat protein